ncbi:MAG: hypothetical protein JWM27_2811 [Gemmatimonadetes bacterium]|nr:hypothetical protein [Gemmatimonadota bacterium]
MLRRISLPFLALLAAFALAGARPAGAGQPATTVAVSAAVATHPTSSRDASAAQSAVRLDVRQLASVRGGDPGRWRIFRRILKAIVKLIIGLLSSAVQATPVVTETAVWDGSATQDVTETYENTTTDETPASPTTTPATCRRRLRTRRAGS